MVRQVSVRPGEAAVCTGPEQRTGTPADLTGRTARRAPSAAVEASRSTCVRLRRRCSPNLARVTADRAPRSAATARPRCSHHRHSHTQTDRHLSNVRPSPAATDTDHPARLVVCGSRDGPTQSQPGGSGGANCGQLRLRAAAGRRAGQTRRAQSLVAECRRQRPYGTG